jgi:D-glycero-alpha-D-manno-heptose-7-phosphate kinase
MIISRTPFRVSFFGGGTDYPAWYREHGGAVLSTAINKYCYITCRYLPPFHDFKYLFRYHKREEAQVIDDIEHPSIRECLIYGAERAWIWYITPIYQPDQDSAQVQPLQLACCIAH